MMTPNKIRAQKHRAKLLANDCRCLEVHIPIWLIEDVREVAQRTKVPMWSAVEDALEAYVTGHTASVAGNHQAAPLLKNNQQSNHQTGRR